MVQEIAVAAERVKKEIAAVESHPWDQLDGEGDTAFALFVTYREMNPLLRSVKAVHELDPSERSMSAVLALQRRWAWTARVKAYDARADELRQARAEEMRREQDEQHQELAAEMAKLSLQAAKLIKPEDVGAQYLPRIADIAVKISHLAIRGENASKSVELVKSFEEEVAALETEMTKREDAKK